MIVDSLALLFTLLKGSPTLLKEMSNSIDDLFPDDNISSYVNEMFPPLETDEDLIYKRRIFSLFVRSEDIEVLTNLAKSRKLAYDDHLFIYEKIQLWSKLDKERALINLSVNPMAPEKIQLSIIEQNSSFNIAIAQNSTNPNVLRKLSKSVEYDIRLNVANNAYTDVLIIKDMIVHAMNNSDEQILLTLLKRKTLAARLLPKIYNTYKYPSVTEYLDSLDQDFTTSYFHDLVVWASNEERLVYNMSNISTQQIDSALEGLSRLKIFLSDPKLDVATAHMHIDLATIRELVYKEEWESLQTIAANRLDLTVKHLPEYIWSLIKKCKKILDSETNSYLAIAQCREALQDVNELKSDADERKMIKDCILSVAFVLADTTYHVRYPNLASRHATVHFGSKNIGTAQAIYMAWTFRHALILMQFFGTDVLEFPRR